MPRRSGREQGFTLVELLLTIAILSLIMGTLAAAFITTAHSTVGIAARFSQSHDAQIASAYLATDVQSNWALTNTPCGSAGTPVLNFGYADGSIATYAYGSVGSETHLTRTYCSGGSVQSAVVAVRNGGGTPDALCFNGPSDPGTACSVASTPQPNKVRIRIPERNSSSGAVDYTYRLEGARRTCIMTVFTTSTTAPCGGDVTTVAPPAPYGLLAFGGGKVTMQGNGSILTVRGPMTVDSTAANAVEIQGNNTPGRLTVTQSFSIRRSPLWSGNWNTDGCLGCQAKATPYPPTAYTASITDPFAGLPYPNEATLTRHPADGQYHGPGVYPALLTISQNTTFAPGIYVLENGMSITNGTIDATSGVLIFNGCGLNSPACAAGTGGALGFSGQSDASLTPMQTGLYTLLAIWQPVQNTNPITMAGNTGTKVVRGILYAPGSTGLSIGAGNGGIQIWCVAGTAITISGNGSAIIGQ